MSTPNPGADGLRAMAIEALEAGQRLCDAHPGTAGTYRSQVDMVFAMLKDETFYVTVTPDEQLEVLRAMAAEMRGSGHWYYCERGHPFTIGECGMPMEEASCPQCEARIGGQHHRLEQGVQRADDLDARLRELHLSD